MSRPPLLGLLLLSLPVSAQVETTFLEPDDGDPAQNFGFDLVLRDDVLLVGAPGNDLAGSDAGAVHVFLRDDRGTPASTFDDVWTQTHTLLPPDLLPGDKLGGRVALSGDVAVLSALEKDGALSESGVVYVYERDRAGTSDPLDDTWVQRDRLLPSTAFVRQRFGLWVAIQGGTIVVGMRDDSGSNDENVFVFERDTAGTPLDPTDDAWIETAVLQELTSPHQRYGWSVDVSADTIVVGARWHDQTSGDDNSGACYVYHRNDAGTPADRTDDTWSAGPLLVPAVLELGGQFGRAVEMNGDTLLIGAWKTLTTGAAYVFERDRKGTPDPADDEWIETALLTPSDGSAGDSFGNGVALGPDVCGVGAFDHDSASGVNSGKLYVYARDDQGTPANRFDDAWHESARLVGSQASTGHGQGNQLTLEGDTLILGALYSSAVHVFDLDGELRLDLETQDDWQTPLENGEVLATGTSFGRWLRLDGLSSAGFLAAAFDSDPSGPNALAEDTDLLVGTGQVLILQEHGAQTLPGVYDFPDDDRFGGELQVELLNGAATPRSIDLIDVDAIPSQEVTLTLHDAAGATRVFQVPSGWTEDVTFDGLPGYRTLDLTTLAPQPGFLATATATESPGFQPDAVTRIEIRVAGSAGLDNLVWNVNGSMPDSTARIVGRRLALRSVPLRSR